MKIIYCCEPLLNEILSGSFNLTNAHLKYCPYCGHIIDLVIEKEK